jgi:hypothetical protein
MFDKLHRPKWCYDACPYCGVALNMVPDDPRVPEDGVGSGVCETCGHLIAVQRHNGRIACVRLKHSVLHDDSNSPEELARARQLQEEIFHRLGQWG